MIVTVVDLDYTPTDHNSQQVKCIRNIKSLGMENGLLQLFFYKAPSYFINPKDKKIIIESD